MRIGTKSILFGAHQFLIHPWFVAWAWWKLYGFPFDPRLWVAFFVHDLGYWGKPNMDGPEGETHVELGAKIMHFLFDPRYKVDTPYEDIDSRIADWAHCHRWRDFCLYHSRFYAKRDGRPFSRLCVADKLAIVLTPAWLYLPMATATGEISEYMKLADKRTADGEPKYASMNIFSDEKAQWYANVQEYLRRWVDEHKDGRQDTWTPNQNKRVTPAGCGND